MAMIDIKSLASEEPQSFFTSMIDITFLLLIFFMCVTEMARTEYEAVTLPKALSAIEDKKIPRDRQIVNVTYYYDNRTGKVDQSYVIRGQKYTLQRLTDYLKGKAEVAEKDEKGVSKLSVKIRADARAEFQFVQMAMMACMKAGVWNLSFGCEPKKGR
jgi:biopolymer transport protein ExbD